jgi:SAM-dependent methyltransferase
VDARTWDERYAAAELVWSARPNQFVESELADLAPGRAVDLAAGEGRNAIWLAEQGWQVTAVDFSLVGLDKGREALERHPRGRDLHVDWVHADVLEWEPGPVGYDLAVVAYLQLVAPERRRAVRHAFDSLVVGGTLLVVAHDTTNHTEGTGGPTDPAVLYTAADVLDDLADRQLQTVRAERVARLVGGGEDPVSHRAQPASTAYDALVRVVRTG